MKFVVEVPDERAREVMEAAYLFTTPRLRPGERQELAPTLPAELDRIKKMPDEELLKSCEEYLKQQLLAPAKRLALAKAQRAVEDSFKGL